MSRGLSAKRFGPLVRGRWGIENSLHWQLDVIFGADRSRARLDHAQANLSVLRRMGLSLQKNETSSKVGVKNRRMTAAWNIDYLHKVLSGARLRRSRRGLGAPLPADLECLPPVA